MGRLSWYRSSTVRPIRPRRVSSIVCTFLMALCLAETATAAGIEDALKVLQSGDMVAAEKALLPLAKERDPRAEFLIGLYVYGNPESKLVDMNKAVPMLLDAAERGYTPAMIPLAGAYADGKGVPKSFVEAYKWGVIAQRWHAANADQVLTQIGQELKPEEIEQAKAAGHAFPFKTK